MIQSMTAFARYQVQNEYGTFNWEIRSVNHRFLDVSIRLPEFFRDLEMEIRDLIKQVISRGKIDCVLYFEENKEINPDIRVNKPLVKAVIKACQEVAELSNSIIPLDPLHLLKWPGVVETVAKVTQPAYPTVIESFGLALKEVIKQRQREGNALKEILLERLLGIEGELEKILTVLPEIQRVQREKLQNALQTIQVEVDNARLEQEIVLLLQKMDIHEEIDRLRTHLAEIKLSLVKDGEVGRHLNFLIQELHREANTIGSKSIAVLTSHASVEMKVLIEQMREQVQNIE